jgi:hypothetical protein
VIRRAAMNHMSIMHINKIFAAAAALGLAVVLASSGIPVGDLLPISTPAALINHDAHHIVFLATAASMAAASVRPELYTRPTQKLPTGEEYKPQSEETFAVWWALLDIIRASQLNTFDPALSIEYKFGAQRKCDKNHTQDFTSLAIFRQDVECLLRDLYGDIESEALDSIVRAIFRTVQQFAKYVRPDIWREHQDAENFDYLFGVGVPEGYGISSGDCRRGMAAKVDLFRRVRAVNADPSTFSEYTIEFAKLFAERWDCTQEYKFGDTSDSL